VQRTKRSRTVWTCVVEAGRRHARQADPRAPGRPWRLRERGRCPRPATRARPTARGRTATARRRHHRARRMCSEKAKGLKNRAPWKPSSSLTLRAWPVNPTSEGDSIVTYPVHRPAPGHRRCVSRCHAHAHPGSPRSVHSRPCALVQECPESGRRTPQIIVHPLNVGPAQRCWLTSHRILQRAARSIVPDGVGVANLATIWMGHPSCCSRGRGITSRCRCESSAPPCGS
jgi:hypothetical protein